MIIEKFISQVCLGYSRDFTRTYFKHIVQLKSGEIKILYSTDTTINKLTYSGNLTEIEPIVEVEAK